MNVLMIGIGAQILKSDGGDVLNRHLDYGKLAGHLTMVLSSMRKENLEPRKFSDHLKVHPTGSRNRMCFIYDAYCLGKRFCEKHTFDLIVTQDPFATAFVGLLLSRQYGIPILMGNHSSFLDNRYWMRDKPIRNKLFNMLGKKLIHHADGLRVVNPQEKEKYIKYGVPAERIWLQATPVPIEKFLNRPSESLLNTIRDQLKLQGKRILLWVGDPTQKAKDLLTLFEAFTEVTKEIEETRLILCGDFSKTPNYANEVRRRSLEDKILFTGRIPYDELPAYYHICDIYVHPSFYEGLAKAIVEAAASGKPIVATAYQGVEAIIQDGKTGVLVPIGDPIRLATELIKLLKDSARLIQLGENAQRFVAINFSRKNMIKGVVDIWQQVAAQSAERRGNYYKKRFF